jgi:S-adenosylmethionine synthetase
MSYLFTSESVSDGHPDKICDQLSDAILDACLAQDPDSRVACECLITRGNLVLSGEITSKAVLNPEEVARQVIEEIGYTDENIGFDIRNAKITNLIQEQSKEINSAVASGGAGDQGTMFGFACVETQELMPLPILLSHRLMKLYSDARKSGELNFLRPDAKSQVTIKYEGTRPVGIDTVVMSAQHDPFVTQKELSACLIENIIRPVIGEYFPDQSPKILINPSGSFVTGGPHGDTGLTGRKIIVDTYGGSCPHGGGAFSGKDPSKVDRSAAYAARWVAKHIVKSGLAERCTVQISYAIGKADPTSLLIDLHGARSVDENRLLYQVGELFDLRPEGIISSLDLLRPIYLPTSTFGHFGRLEFPWEQMDEKRIEELQNLIT